MIFWIDSLFCGYCWRKVSISFLFNSPEKLLCVINMEETAKIKPNRPNINKPYTKLLVNINLKTRQTHISATLQSINQKIANQNKNRKNKFQIQQKQKIELFLLCFLRYLKLLPFIGIFKIYSIIFKNLRTKDITMPMLINSESKTAGRWTKEEHQKFLYGLKLYGKNWKKIEDLIETRSSTQIRSHAQKFFIKMKKLDNDDSDSEIIEHESHSKLNQETIITHHEDRFLEKETSDFSFYFGQIARNYLQSEKKGQEFNFWTLLVESPQVKNYKSCELLRVPQYELEMRKMSSFSEFKSQEVTKSCQLIRSEHSPFEEYKE